MKMPKIPNSCQTPADMMADCTTSTYNDAATLKCRVCGASADGQHFGTSACRACAAFFRRTVSRRLRYICRFDNDCEIGDVSRSVCRSCRLAKCLEVGMNGRAVRSKQSSLDRPTPRRAQKMTENLPNLIKEYDDRISHHPHSQRHQRDETENKIMPLFASTAGASPLALPSTSSSSSGLAHNIIGRDLALTAAVKSSPPPPSVPPAATFDATIWSSIGTSSSSSYFAPESVFAFAPSMSPDIGTTNAVPYSTLPLATSTATASTIVPPPATVEISVETSSMDHMTMQPATLIVSAEDAPASSGSMATTSDCDGGNELGKLFSSSLSSLSSSSSSSPSISSYGKRRLLYDIVELKATDFFVNETTLPPTHPTLAKVQIAYEGLQRRRDVFFARSRECNGYSTRIYVERQVFDVHQYWKNIQMEIEWVAEMLSTFDNYSLIPNADKVQIFKHYWIHFIILERSFDTYRVLGTSLTDLRMVFANGDINDVVVGEYDIKEIADVKDYGIKSISHPWFKSAALEILIPLKKLQPTEPEMMFCLALMFWKLTYDVTSRVAVETAQLAEQMTELLYREIYVFYSTHFSHVNYVKRVGELVRLIGITERLVLHRKEDIIMQRTFKPFKVDLYMEEIFDSD